MLRRTEEPFTLFLKGYVLEMSGLEKEEQARIDMNQMVWSIREF